MEARAREGADRHGHGRGHPRREPVGERPRYGDLDGGGFKFIQDPNFLGIGGTGPLQMEERDVRGVYSRSPETGGICLGGVVGSDVGDAVRIKDLRDIEIPYYDGTPSNLDDFILDWEDFAEEVAGEMSQGLREKWACRTFPHRLAQDPKEDLRDRIRQGAIRTAQACLQLLEDEERVDALYQQLEDLWSIPLPLELGEFRVRD